MKKNNPSPERDWPVLGKPSVVLKLLVVSRCLLYLGLLPPALVPAVPAAPMAMTKGTVAVVTS